MLLAGKSLLALSKPADALKLLEKFYTLAPQPAADLLSAQAFEATGDLPAAAARYQQVYYLHPGSQEAETAAEALGRLSQSMGANFPPVTSQLMFTRLDRLITARRFSQARSEAAVFEQQVSGQDRELLRVKRCEIEFFERTGSHGLNCLTSLSVDSPAASAERLYYLHAAARRLGRESEAVEAADELRQKHRGTRWATEALLSTANLYLLRGDSASADRYYQLCYENAPADPAGAGCHWKVTWSKYMSRSAEAERLLREHLDKFPTSPKAPAAAYFLARLQPGEAKRHYRFIVEQAPNSFYAVLARQALGEAGAGAARNRTELDSRFLPTPATRSRIERARLVAQAGLEEWAEGELRFGAQTDAQPFLIALELAEQASRRGDFDQAVRYIKSLAPGYLSIPFEAAPRRFWELAFPLPYRNTLERYSRQHQLDVFLVAGLIRQESEFNPRAVSPAKAYGLTQVLPSTGRLLARQMGIRRFHASLLFDPDTNIRLGTNYLRRVHDELEGKWEAALASYNAGKSRVLAWLSAHSYSEPAEFIESIPFTETREYVQAVLRNADIYRRLYGQGADAELQPHSRAPRIARAFTSQTALASRPAKAALKLRRSKPKATKRLLRSRVTRVAALSTKPAAHTAKIR